jgi:uncharacterized surface protein with fasciclin (FAS1) repeats
MKKKLGLLVLVLPSTFLLNTSLLAQQNVFDDVIATSPNHTYLEAALIQENLDDVLKDPNATFTVFAPDDKAFLNLAAKLNTDIDGLLALSNLSDILRYHVLGKAVLSTILTNGLIETPLNNANTLKITIDGANVYVNQAQVSAPDLLAENGVVHFLEDVVLPNKTVADIALGSPDHTTLVTAVVEARLLPALTDPFSSLTVFAPTDNAIADALNFLGQSANQLIGTPELSEILLYHVLGSKVLSTSLSNGQIVTPLNNANTLKVTIDGSDVYINQAKVTKANLQADNGVVHVLNEVVLPNKTVVDIAIGSTAHTSLVSAVIKARLLPVLTDPFEEFTVFAPTDVAFSNLASSLKISLDDVLARPDLTDILTYHVVSGRVLSKDLTAGPVPTLSDDNVIVSLTGGVKINDANVTTPDLTSENGVVHVLDKVLLSAFLGIEEASSLKMNVFPNPFQESVTIAGLENATYSLANNNGKIILSGIVNGVELISTSNLSSGVYTLSVKSNSAIEKKQIIKL